MNNFRDIILILAGLAVIVVFGLGVIQSSWTQELAEIVGVGSVDATETPVITTTVESLAVPAPALRVIPAELVFHGVRRSLWENAVFDGPVLLTIAEAEDKTITLLHPPVYSPDLPGQANLVVTPQLCEKTQYQVFTVSTPSVTRTPAPATTAQSTASATTIVEATPPPVDPKCYSVGIDNEFDGTAGIGKPGVYSSTIQLSAEEGGEPTTVDVKVKIRYWILWPILMVTLGVVTTEFLVWWGKRWGHYGWRNRRVQWLDLLSERLDWTKMFGADNEVKGEAVRQVKGQLRKEHEKLAGWLSKAKEGKVTIGQLPASEAEAEDMVHPLKQLIAYYLGNQHDLGGKSDDLRTALAALSKSVPPEALEHLKLAVKTKTPALYTGLKATDKPYRQLEQLWKPSSPGPQPTNALLAAAWETLQGINKEAGELQRAFDAFKVSILPSTANLAELAVAAGALGAHLKAFQTKVIEPAKRQLGAVNTVLTTEPGQKETREVLVKYAALATFYEAAQAAVNKANQPLKESEGTMAGAKVVIDIEKKLQVLGDKIREISPDTAPLNDQAISDTMLKAVRENLRNADAQMSQPHDDLEKVWTELSFTYGKDLRFVRIGRRLKRLSDDTDYYEVKNYMRRAYLCLLRGDALAAEIELEQAEAILSKQWFERPLGKIRDVWNHTFRRPDAEGIFEALAVGSGGWRTVVITIVVAILIALLRQPEPGLAALSLGNSIWSWIVWVLQNIVFWVVIGFAALLILVLVWRRLRLGILWNELQENLLPWMVLFFLKLSSQLLTIVVAVALILVANSLVDVADTWGSKFDFITAFTWGVIANRLVGPVQSATKKVKQLLQGEEPVADEGAEKSEEQGSENAE